MALALTFQITESIGSDKIYIKDTTALSHYTDNIPAITTEALLSSAITALTLRLTSSDGSFDETVSIVSYKDDLRTANGAELNISTLFGEDTIADELYTIVLTYTISSVVYTFTVYEVFYQDIRKSVALNVAASDWKDSFNYKSTSSSSKYSLQIKSYYDQMVTYNDNGLYNDSLAILTALKSIL